MKRRFREGLRDLFTWFDDRRFVIVLALALLVLLYSDWIIETIRQFGG